MYKHIYYIYAIIKAICPPGYRCNGFVATHALEHMVHIVFMITYILRPSCFCDQSCLIMTICNICTLIISLGLL